MSIKVWYKTIHFIFPRVTTLFKLSMYKEAVYATVLDGYVELFKYMHNTDRNLIRINTHLRRKPCSVTINVVPKFDA